jgi:transposase
MKPEYVGVDISKDKFDVYFQDQTWTVKQTSEMIKKDFIQTLKEKTNTIDNVIVVCEASGGYERLLTSTLAKEKIKYHVAHAQFIKAYAKSYGLKAKTDKIDAKNIADYAKEREVLPDEILSENKVKIGDLLKRREQLINDKVREGKRLDKHQDQQNQESIKRHITWLTDELKKIDQALDDVVKSDTSLQEEMKILISVPGIGRIVALHIMAFLPEIGHISNKKISALVGLAPYNNDSGKHHGKRSILGGRSKLRCLFYISALVNKTHNAELKIFYERLINQGKPVKVALIAVARKTICMLNSVVARQEEWVKYDQIAN